MNRYNESVLQKWTNNVERELFLNGNNHDLNDSQLFEYGEGLNYAVEGGYPKYCWCLLKISTNYENRILG